MSDNSKKAKKSSVGGRLSIRVILMLVIMLSVIVVYNFVST